MRYRKEIKYNKRDVQTYMYKSKTNFQGNSKKDKQAIAKVFSSSQYNI